MRKDAEKGQGRNVLWDEWRKHKQRKGVADTPADIMRISIRLASLCKHLSDTSRAKAVLQRSRDEVSVADSANSLGITTGSAQYTVRDKYQMPSSRNGYESRLSVEMEMTIRSICRI